MAEKKWSGKSRGGAFGTWFFVVTLKYLGVGAAYVLLAFVAPYFVLFAPKGRRAIMKYNREILGYGRWKSLWKVFVHFYVFGQTIIDKIALKHGIEKPYTFDYINYEEFLKVLDSGTGVIIIGAHVGSWEVGAPYFNKYGKDMNIVMLDGEYEQIKRVIEDGAEKQPFKIIPLGTDGLDSILKIKAALDRKEYVCFQGDRYMDEENSIEREFMGKKARFPKGLFQVAAKLGVPVVYYYAMRENGKRYSFSFEIANTESKNSKERFGKIVDQYIETLEKTVKRHPQQWFNFYDFWSE
ncbi:MAG: acyltransferase [Bacteroidales bacterium]|nr:acyltransferase [Bacteroidales bacterium]